MAYHQARQRDPLLDEETAAVIERRGRELAGLALLAAGGALLALMWSYAPSDPSWLVATDGPVANWLGRPGAAVASPLRVIVGGGAYALGLILLAWGVRLLLHLGHARAASRLVFAPLAVALASLHAATLVPGAGWGHSFGLGGLFGDTALGALLAGLPFATPAALRALAALSGLAALALGLYAAGVTGPELRAAWRFVRHGVVLTYAWIAGRTGAGARGVGRQVRVRADARVVARAERARRDAGAEGAETPRVAREPRGGGGADGAHDDAAHDDAAVRHGGPIRDGDPVRDAGPVAGAEADRPRGRLASAARAGAAGLAGLVGLAALAGEAHAAPRAVPPLRRSDAPGPGELPASADGARRTVVPEAGGDDAPAGDEAPAWPGSIRADRAAELPPPVRPAARSTPLVARPSQGPVPYPEAVVAAPASARATEAEDWDPAQADPKEAWRLAREGMAAFRAELAARGPRPADAPRGGEAVVAAPSARAAPTEPPVPLPRFLAARPDAAPDTETPDGEEAPGAPADASAQPSASAARGARTDGGDGVGAPAAAGAPVAAGVPAAAGASAVAGAPAAIRRGAPRPVRATPPRPAAYERPPLGLLTDPATVERHHLADEALEENARVLEGVLDDYGVKGEIVSVRPGPVVTMYELEPAPGLKASRVIGLADDIARSMSALSARVSTVPGRSVIGIELPNDKREKVVLREILSARGFDGSMRLPLALGKDIGGGPTVADLARMPHLLIAGTTGSGKSVAINTMILSLLYTLSPEECRLIMIDPKMLELSVYDGIPHLLSPVVTDPKKAVVALKWVVAEMEERYRRMSKLGVRNIDGFNGRVREALAKGETFSRTVQTGFDDETGDPVFETEEIAPEAMPFIVVIVDEMADLMMVAGKEIEACIQRLAQMARASGIHLIMATQRPSVDVITGTIKANFPTRISFQVTSKIDSRTILGEQGAEQLLGMGDMLHMAGGSRITRVHGPFVSDEEVEEVVAHLKALGPPEYVGAVVEGPEEGEADIDAVLGLSGGGGGGGGDDALYDQAVAIVAHDRKCSTSYIQRKLGIGYNKAARLVEQMEEEGVVSPSNHVGKRDVLVPEAP